MLQQTHAARVAPAFRSFIERFPSVDVLAAASRREVLRAWSGLGYNRRAASLLDAARIIANEHGGRVPSDPTVLARLPGIGPYTAAAVASIAFSVPLPAIDTNVRRVVARAMLGEDTPTTRPREVDRAAASWMGGADPGLWNQAVMDLGREVCRPIPRCPSCPIASVCAFRRRGRSAGLRAAGNTGRPAKPRFEGSLRQLRGAIVRLLTDLPSASLGSLGTATGRSLTDVAEAVAALAADGLVEAGPAALAGRPGGRVRVAD
jgi:A/G-specific adenine glycosylase